MKKILACVAALVTSCIMALTGCAARAQGVKVTFYDMGKADAATFGVTFAIGVIVQAVQPWFAHIQMGVLLGNFVGGWLTAVLAQMLQIALPVYNVNAAIIGGIMPLLSGLAMTTAVRDTVYGDLVSGMTRALEAMLLATAVAIGVYTGLKMAAMMGGITL